MSDPWDWTRADLPSRGFQWATAVWAIMALVVSVSVYSGWLGLAVVTFGPALGVAWCVHAARRFVPGNREPVSRRALRAWLFCPLVGLTLVALCYSRLPLVGRVWVSEGALLEVAEKVREDRVSLSGNRVGLMYVDYVYRSEGAVFFFTDDAPIFNEYGLVYTPDGNEPSSRAHAGWMRGYDHLYGNWWTFHARD